MNRRARRLSYCTARNARERSEKETSHRAGATYSESCRRAMHPTPWATNRSRQSGSAWDEVFAPVLPAAGEHFPAVRRAHPRAKPLLSNLLQVAATPLDLHGLFLSLLRNKGVF